MHVHMHIQFMVDDCFLNKAICGIRRSRFTQHHFCIFANKPVSGFACITRLIYRLEKIKTPLVSDNQVNYTYPRVQWGSHRHISRYILHLLNTDEIWPVFPTWKVPLLCIWWYLVCVVAFPCSLNASIRFSTKSNPEDNNEIWAM